MYVAGELAQMHETLLETFCLVEGLTRMGFTQKNISVLCAVAEEKHAKVALLAPLVKAGDRIVVVRLSEVVTEKLLAAYAAEGVEVPLETEIRWFGTVGAVPDWSDEEFRAHYRQAAQVFLDSLPSEAGAAWQRSRAKAILPRLENVLRSKGFEVRS